VRLPACECWGGVALFPPFPKRPQKRGRTHRRAKVEGLEQAHQGQAWVDKHLEQDRGGKRKGQIWEGKNLRTGASGAAQAGTEGEGAGLGTLPGSRLEAETVVSSAKARLLAATRERRVQQYLKSTVQSERVRGRERRAKQAAMGG